MKYPRLVNGLSYKNNYDGTVIVKDNRIDESYLFEKESVRILQHLDGKTDPYNGIETYYTPGEIGLLIEFLIEEELIEYSRISASNGNILIRLFNIKVSMKKKIISFVLNVILMNSFLPIFIYGLCMFLPHYNELEFRFPLFFVGAIIGVLLGAPCHEFGHLVAALGLGGKAFSMGILLGITPGMYVEINEKCIKSTLRKVQVLLAGIEVNLLLAGLFFIISTLFSSSLFYGIAFNNLLLAVINLLFIDGLDGYQAMQILLGANELNEKAKRLRNETAKNELLSEGILGYIKFILFRIIRYNQLAYPVLVLINIGGGLFWIIN